MANNFYGSHEVYTLRNDQKKFFIVVDDDFGYRLDDTLYTSINSIVKNNTNVYFDVIVQRRPETSTVKVDMEYRQYARPQKSSFRSNLEHDNLWYHYADMRNPNTTIKVDVPIDFNVALTSSYDDFNDQMTKSYDEDQDDDELGKEDLSPVVSLNLNTTDNDKRVSAILKIFKSSNFKGVDKCKDEKDDNKTFFESLSCQGLSLFKDDRTKYDNAIDVLKDEYSRMMSSLKGNPLSVENDAFIKDSIVFYHLVVRMERPYNVRNKYNEKFGNRMNNLIVCASKNVCMMLWKYINKTYENLETSKYSSVPDVMMIYKALVNGLEKADDVEKVARTFFLPIVDMGYRPYTFFNNDKLEGQKSYDIKILKTSKDRDIDNVFYSKVLSYGLEDMNKLSQTNDNDLFSLEVGGYKKLVKKNKTRPESFVVEIEKKNVIVSVEFDRRMIVKATYENRDDRHTLKFIKNKLFEQLQETKSKNVQGSKKNVKSKDKKVDNYVKDGYRRLFVSENDVICDSVMNDSSYKNGENVGVQLSYIPIKSFHNEGDRFYQDKMLSRELKYNNKGKVIQDITYDTNIMPKRITYDYETNDNGEIRIETREIFLPSEDGDSEWVKHEINGIYNFDEKEYDEKETLTYGVKNGISFKYLYIQDEDETSETPKEILEDLIYKNGEIYSGFKYQYKEPDFFERNVIEYENGEIVSKYDEEYDEEEDDWFKIQNETEVFKTTDRYEIEDISDDEDTPSIIGNKVETQSYEDDESYEDEEIQVVKQTQNDNDSYGSQDDDDDDEYSSDEDDDVEDTNVNRKVSVVDINVLNKEKDNSRYYILDTPKSSVYNVEIQNLLKCGKLNCSGEDKDQMTALTPDDDVKDKDIVLIWNENVYRNLDKVKCRVKLSKLYDRNKSPLNIRSSYDENKPNIHFVKYLIVSKRKDGIINHHVVSETLVYIQSSSPNVSPSKNTFQKVINDENVKLNITKDDIKGYIEKETEKIFEKIKGNEIKQGGWSSFIPFGSFDILPLDFVIDGKNIVYNGINESISSNSITTKFRETMFKELYDEILKPLINLSYETINKL